MGRPRKQVEAETPLPQNKNESVVENGLRNGRQEEKEEEKWQVVLVKMYREHGRVKTADVHPSEVENCLHDGWLVLEE